MRLLPMLMLTAVTLAGCAGLCERRERFFQSRCAGSNVAYTPDGTCEDRIRDCSDEQLALMDAYVKCLESAQVCSMEVVARCAQAHPGGVNLACPRRD
jgi:hypothetical protein